MKYDKIKRCLRHFGIEVMRFDMRLPIVRRMHLLSTRKISLVLDIGANVGQFGQELREFGYAGRIVSFEPVTSAFVSLSKAARRDPNWVARCEALGESNTQKQIKVSENSVSSSFHEMCDLHERAAPSSRYIGQETVRVRRLDSIFEEIGAEGQRIFCKIDTQGSEKQVLEGAGERLKDIDLIYLETSLVPLYKESWLLEDTIRYMREKCFVPLHIEQGFFDQRSGRSYQVDLIFGKEKL